LGSLDEYFAVTGILNDVAAKRVDLNYFYVIDPKQVSPDFTQTRGYVSEDDDQAAETRRQRQLVSDHRLRRFALQTDLCRRGHIRTAIPALLCIDVFNRHDAPQLFAVAMHVRVKHEAARRFNRYGRAEEQIWRFKKCKWPDL
jgi:hypothetical protein